MGNRSYLGTVLGDVVGAAAWGSKIYTSRGGLDGCEQMCTLHAEFVLGVCLRETWTVWRIAPCLVYAWNDSPNRPCLYAGVVLCFCNYVTRDDLMIRSCVVPPNGLIRYPRLGLCGLPDHTLVGQTHFFELPQQMPITTGPMCVFCSFQNNPLTPNMRVAGRVSGRPGP